MVQSHYNHKELTPPQFLAERICQRIAKKEKKSLCYRFWQTDEWKKTYQLQVIKASILLKEYTFEEITRALANPKAAFIYTFGSKALWKPYLEQARKTLAKEVEKSINTIDVDEDAVFEKPITVRSTKNLIMELD